MTKRIILVLGLLAIAATAQAGLKFGLQAGAYSPTSGIEDNDNGLIFGADIWFKFTVIGIKLEAYHVDTSGRLEDELGDGFGETHLNVDNLVSLDAMYFPIGTTFFIQGGLNHINLDVNDVDRDILDNSTGIELGAGISLVDKLLIQAKIIYTPDAFEQDAVDTIIGLDDTDAQGYMVSVGWHF